MMNNDNNPYKNNRELELVKIHDKNPENSLIFGFAISLSVPRPAVEGGRLAWWFVKGPTDKDSMTTTVTSWTSRLTLNSATFSPAQALPPGIAAHGSRYDSTNSFFLCSLLRVHHCEKTWHVIQ